MFPSPQSSCRLQRTASAGLQASAIMGGLAWSGEWFHHWSTGQDSANATGTRTATMVPRLEPPEERPPSRWKRARDCRQHGAKEGEEGGNETVEAYYRSHCIADS